MNLNLQRAEAVYSRPAGDLDAGSQMSYVRVLAMTTKTFISLKLFLN